jgi:hypothetical protein
MNFIPGAAGCRLAAFRQLAQAGEFHGKQVEVVCCTAICSGNIAVPVLQ